MNKKRAGRGSKILFNDSYFLNFTYFENVLNPKDLPSLAFARLQPRETSANAAPAVRGIRR
jgi:hypothetical protein